MEIAKIWRNKDQMLRLEGEICPQGHILFPKRDICPHCNNEAKTHYKLSGKGTIYSYTTIYEAPAGFENQSPFNVALVKLEEGPMITAQLTDFPTHTEVQEIDGEMREVVVYDVNIGDEVEMVSRKLSEDGDRGLIRYGYKFRPPV